MSENDFPNVAASTKTVTIVTPALAAANNGNWRTADRWSQFLSDLYDLHITKHWAPDDAEPDVMIALHARRSAEDIARFSTTGKPIVLVLTGTDLYRDIHQDDSAQRSLQLASHLVVLQQAGLAELPPDLRNKCSVIEQSAPSMMPLAPRPETFDLLLVGHLRAEKDPLTAARTLQNLSEHQISLRTIGRTDDQVNGKPATRIAASGPRTDLQGNQGHPHKREQNQHWDNLTRPNEQQSGATDS